MSDGSERRALARGGALGFLGSVLSAALGFALTIVFTRALGDAGTGIVLQAIAIFSIVLALGKLGMDSAAVWMLPRMTGRGVFRARATVLALALSAAVGGALAALVTLLLLPVLGVEPQTIEAVRTIAWGIPVAAVLMVGLAATRGLGGMRAYIGIGSIGLPALRLAAVVGVALLGATALGAAVAWTVPLVVALVAVAVVVAWQLRRHERAAGVTAPPLLVGRRRYGAIWAYAAPRTVSAGLEQALLWLDVVLVGTLAGAAAAGVYGGASRFIAAGLVVDSALRIVVSPRFSFLLSRNRLGDVQQLYRTAALWLVVFSTPIYLVLAFFGPVALSWLGPEFVAGERALAILCAGAIVTFAAGNVHSVLLMSGRSGWAAINKAIVLVLNVVGGIVLIPLLGIEGAAIAWAVSMLVDATLATIQVRLLVGVSPDLRAVAYALLVVLACVAVPAAVLRLTLGATLLALVLSIVVGGVLLAFWCYRDRERLQFSEFFGMLRRRRPPNGGD